MEKGELVPDEVTINMVLERIALPDCASGCLFDGFPRTLEQAEALDKRLAEAGRSIDKAVYIDVPEDELVRRLSGRWVCRNCQAPYHMLTSPPRTPGECDRCGGGLYQRPDDREETVRERLKVFLSRTVPMLDYYREQHKLVQVDGCRGIEEVGREMISLLKTSEE
jgi:adenylate kinase